MEKGKRPRFIINKQGEGILTAIPDITNNRVITGDYYGNIKAWSLSDGKFKYTQLSVRYPVKYLQLLLQGSVLGIVLKGNTSVLICNINPKSYYQFGTSLNIAYLEALLLESTVVVSLGSPKSFNVVELKTFNIIKSIDGIGSRILHYKTSIDYKYIIASSADKMVFVIEIDTGNKLMSLELVNKHANIVQFSEDTDLIYFACSDGEVQIWEWRFPEIKLKFNASENKLHCISLSSCNEILLTVDQVKGVQVWELNELIHSKSDDDSDIPLWKIPKSFPYINSFKRFFITNLKEEKKQDEERFKVHLLNLINEYCKEDVYFRYLVYTTLIPYCETDRQKQILKDFKEKLNTCIAGAEEKTKGIELICSLQKGKGIEFSLIKGKHVNKEKGSILKAHLFWFFNTKWKH